MHSKTLKALAVIAASVVFVIGSATPSSTAAADAQPGPWGGPTSQPPQTIAFTVNAGTPQTVDPISFGANLNCPVGPDFSVGHGFFGFQTPIDENNQFVLVFGPAQGSIFTYTRVTGTFTSDTTAEGVLNERWAALVSRDQAELCNSGRVTWTATPGGFTETEIDKYDHYFKHTKGADGRVTTVQLK